MILNNPQFSGIQSCYRLLSFNEIFFRNQFAAITVGLIILLSGSTAGNAAAPDAGPTDAAPADRFKEFIANPPVIEDAFYSQQVIGYAPLYYWVKWQPGALFLGVSLATNLAAVPAKTRLLSCEQQITAGFGEKFRQVIHSTDLYVWTNKNIPDEQNNSLFRTYKAALDVQGAELLNMGCLLAEVGSIRWAGDDFTVTNHSRGIVVQGQLTRDSKGRASALSVQPRMLDRKSKNSGYYPRIYEYFYETNLALSYLPSRIVATHEDEKGQQGLQIEYKIFSMKTANSSLPEESFIFDSSHFPNIAETLVISNKHVVHYPKVGAVHMFLDEEPLRQSRAKINLGYTAVAILLLIFPPFLYWFLRRKQETALKTA